MKPGSMMSRVVIACLACLLVTGLPDVASARSPSPPVLLQASPPGRNLARLPDGSLRIFFVVPQKHCASIRSDDHGTTWSEPVVEFELPGLRGGAPCSLVDRDGELHVFLLIWRGEGRRFGVDRCLDIWHARTTGGRRQWVAPKCIFEGYVGSMNGVEQLDSGRIVVPHQYWVPGRETKPPTGSHEVTAVYSDDGGRTWQPSPARLTAPCHADFNGNNYGACEPTILEVERGHVWMLMRSQTGLLYESFSVNGAEWSEARPSRFVSSSSPASLLRLPDGRIVVFWNNCESPPRVDGQGVYVGRDVLTAAISRDQGNTWRGYREVYRDPMRNDPPPKRGDRGTAYPFSIATQDGRILLATGQGRGRTALLRIDPDWLEATCHEDDFSNGLDGWTVFKAFGPASGYWRNRTQGARLVDHPAKPGAKVLHVRRPDEKPGDGAVWNFPAGRQGKLTLRILLQEGFAGAIVALADRFINPTDTVGEKKVLFRLPVTPDGQLDGQLNGGPKLETGRWYNLGFHWHVDAGQCKVTLDAQPATMLTLLNNHGPGVCYLRLRSTTKTIDAAGLFVESVEVDVGKEIVVHKKGSELLIDVPVPH